MVVQKSLDNLKGRPEDERKAVAGGIAVSVVVILLIIWSVFFFKKIATGSQDVNLSSGAQDAFNPSSTLQAQAALQEQAQSGGEDLTNLRNDAAANQLQSAQGTGMQGVGGTDTSQFGGSYPSGE